MKCGMGVVACGLAALTAGVVCAGDVIPPLEKIKSDRPRVLLRPEATPHAISVAQLKAIPRDADFNVMLEQLRKDSSAAAQAMVWLLTGEKGAADKAIERMRKYKYDEASNSFTVYFTLREFALAYDWLYNYEGFTKETKAAVRAGAAPLAKKGLEMSNDHVFHNYVWMSSGGLALWALATAGEDKDSDDLFGQVRERFNTRLFPAWKYLDGLPGEPMWYWGLYCFQPGALAVLGAESAFETDVAGLIRKDGDWLGRHYDYLIHVTMPDLQYIPWGDTKFGGPDGGVTHEMAGVSDGVAWLLRSPQGAYFSEWMAKSPRGLKRFYGETAIFYMLYTRNLSAKGALPPLSFAAGGPHGGHFIARDKWAEDATVVGFRCADHYGDHNHYDQGSFVVYHRGYLAVDPGVYKKVGGPQQSAEVHNTLLIGGGQRKPRGQWFKTVEEFQENLRAGKMLETGDMLFHRDAGDWAAVAGEFGQAYDPAVVRSCVRQILFLRPDKVIVVDQILPPAGKELPAVKWLLQVPQAPKVETGEVVATNGKAWLRCQPVLPGPSIPTVTENAEMKVQTVAYSYKGAGGLALVHVLSVGEKAPESAEVKASKTRDGIDVSIGDKRFRFAVTGSYEVSVSKE